MTDVNPYQPPTQESPELRLPDRHAKFEFGWKGNLVLALVGGTFVGALIQMSKYDSLPFFLFGFPLIGWFFTLLILVSMLRPTNMSAAQKGSLAAALTIPAYFLYVPICTVASVFSTSIFGAEGYGPTTMGAIFTSAVTFVVVLFAIAGIIRRRASAGLAQVDESVLADDMNPDSEIYHDVSHTTNEPPSS